MTPHLPALAFILALAAASGAEAQTHPAQIFFQAHRGGLLEVPENTLAALRHAWACPGAVPEIDLRTTKDGVLICLHDDTPARTLEVPEAFHDTDIAEISFEQLREWDAGVKFGPRYTGESVPRLDEVFEMMKQAPQRQIYLDLKGVDLDDLDALIRRYGLLENVIFVHGKQSTCVALKKRFEGARTMTWLSGIPFLIKRRFEDMAETGFQGIDQIQFHLKTNKAEGAIEYVFDEDYLRYAFQKTKAAGVQLQLRPFRFDAASLRPLIEIGVRWFVADEPRRFSQALADAIKPARPAAPKEESFHGR